MLIPQYALIFPLIYEYGFDPSPTMPTCVTAVSPGAFGYASFRVDAGAVLLGAGLVRR